MAPATSQPHGNELDRPQWLPWSAFPFRSRFAAFGGKRIHAICAWWADKVATAAGKPARS